MADEKDAKAVPKKKRIVLKRKRETVRERADKSAKSSGADSKSGKIKSAVVKPVKHAKTALGKEYTPIKTGDSKVGKTLSKKTGFTSYFRKSYQELKLVTWPTRKTAAKLTFAVIVFSTVLAVVIRLIDLGFEFLVKDAILR